MQSVLIMCSDPDFSLRYFSRFGKNKRQVIKLERICLRMPMALTSKYKYKNCAYSSTKFVIAFLNIYIYDLNIYAYKEDTIRKRLQKLFFRFFVF